MKVDRLVAKAMPDPRQRVGPPTHKATACQGTTRSTLVGSRAVLPVTDEAAGSDGALA